MGPWLQMSEDGLNYTPPKTVAAFMRSPAIMRVLVGPLGSGKSMGAIMELFRRACEQDPDARGIRPTRFVVVRNSAAQLRETTLADCKQYLPFARWKVSTATLEFRMPMPDGTVVHSDWLFLPLERSEDTRKLLSLNLTGGFVEECREIQYGIVAALMGRIGRFPMKARVEPTWQGILCASNPWAEGSDWHEHLVIAKPEDWELFVQPGGLDPDAENVENLPTDYYERLMHGHSQEWINVHVHALWGDDPSGTPVFRASFDKPFHTTDEPLRAVSLRPLLVGIDFGRTGAAIIGQEAVTGQLLCLKEILAEDAGLESFLEDYLKPWLRDHYWDHRIFVVGDPAGAQRSQLREETAFQMLHRHGLEAIPAATNNISERLRAVERRLLDSIGRGPAILISNEGCPTLVKALHYGYRYRRKRAGDLEDLPDKNAFSHPADALEYLCLAANSNYVGRRLRDMQSRHLGRRATPTRVPTGAWT